MTRDVAAKLKYQKTASLMQSLILGSLKKMSLEITTTKIKLIWLLMTLLMT
jgi:hypothetical protein